MGRVGLTKALVVAAGAELADADGFEGVTVSTLARRLEVRTPSLYSHIAGNADLRLRITALALDEAADRAVAALEGRSGQAALTAYADTWRAYARAHPGRYAATRQPVPADGTDAAAAALAAGRRHADLMRDVLVGYAIDAADRNHAVRLVGSVVHGFITLELGGGFAHSEPSPDESWRYALAMLDRSLAG